MRIVVGNILDTPADGLLLTIDGSKRGLEGNLARQFEKRWPDDWQDMQPDIRYPVPLGKTVAVPWDGDCPWKYIIFASTLHHLDAYSENEKRTIVNSAFFDAIHRCRRLGVASLSTIVLRGGWRLSMQDAFRAMNDAWKSSHAHSRGPAVTIFVTNEEERVALESLRDQY